MDAQDFWKPVDTHSFLNRHLFLAASALVAAVNHFFSGEVMLQAVVDAHAASKFEGLPRNFNTQVHEVIEGSTLMVAGQTTNRTHQLSLKQVSHYRVISLFHVVSPCG